VQAATRGVRRHRRRRTSFNAIANTTAIEMNEIVQPAVLMAMTMLTLLLAWVR
jgi:hypothetical protein